MAQARRTLITSRAALAAGLPSLVRPPPYGPGIEETLRQLLRHAALPDPLRLLLRDEHESASWKLAERLLTALGRDLAPNVDERIACAAAASRLLRDPRAEGGADG